MVNLGVTNRGLSKHAGAALSACSVPCLLILLPVSVLLVQLQAESCDHQQWREYVFYCYLSPSPRNVVYLARPLVRWIIESLRYYDPFGISAESINLFVQLTFLWAALYRMSCWLLQRLEQPWALTGALLLAATIPWGFLRLGSHLSYPYDFPALFFSVAGLEAITAGRWRVLALLVGFGTLNKETIVWLIPAYAGWVWIQKRNMSPVIARVAGLTAIFALCYALPRIPSVAGAWQGIRNSFSLMHHDSSGLQIPRYVTNLRELRFSQWGGFWQNVYWPLAVFLPSIIFWRRLPPWLQAMHAGLPFFLLPVFLCGNVWELRLYYEILPLGIMAQVWVLANWRDSRPQRASATQPRISGGRLRPWGGAK
jgi:hypothetical protein